MERQTIDGDPTFNIGRDAEPPVSRPHKRSLWQYFRSQPCDFVLSGLLGLVFVAVFSSLCGVVMVCIASAITRSQ